MAHRRPHRSGQGDRLSLRAGPPDLPHQKTGPLPMTRQEMSAWGWDELDVLLVSGDAYVDHPSFGSALLGRWLVAHGYRVGIVAQPRWTSTQDIARMGRPRLFAGVTAGALDSMLAHYTAFRKKRSDDAYTPGGQAGARPNRATIVYSSLIKQAFPKLPIILGGIEASLRRLTHYDFWTDKLRRSLLLDAKADVILYGMAERGVLELARIMKDECGRMKDESEEGSGLRVQGSARALHAATGNWQLTTGNSSDSSFILHPSSFFETIPGAAYIGDPSLLPPGAKIVEIPSHEEISRDPKKLMEATLAAEAHVHHADAFLVQRVENRAVVLTPPRPLESAELDRLYSLPFNREPHPSYGAAKIPAAEMIRFSITSHRGCAGGCSFCSLAAHQGRTLRSRSADSIAAEAQEMAAHEKFTGSISDIGGPSANMWGGYCADDPTRCQRASCLYPSVCPHLVVDQMKIVEMLQRAKKVPGVKHVRVASGIRHDLASKDANYVRSLVREFVGGQLKIAPEHLCDAVLRLMRKPGQKVFEQFLEMFERECHAAGKQQFVIPYLISAFPGCTQQHMRELSAWLKKRGWNPQQVQCFIPLPGTVAAAMYFAGIDASGRPIPVAKSDAERLRMHYELVGRQTDSPRSSRRARSKSQRGPRRHEGTKRNF